MFELILMDKRLYVIIITTITNIQDDQFTNVRDNSIIIIILYPSKSAQELLERQFYPQMFG